MNRYTFKRDFALRLASFTPKDPGARTAQFQATLVPRGLSPAQVAEFLTTGRIRGPIASSRISQDEPLLLEAGATGTRVQISPFPVAPRSLLLAA